MSLAFCALETIRFCCQLVAASISWKYYSEKAWDWRALFRHRRSSCTRIRGATFQIAEEKGPSQRNSIKVALPNSLRTFFRPINWRNQKEQRRPFHLLHLWGCHRERDGHDWNDNWIPTHQLNSSSRADAGILLKFQSSRRRWRWGLLFRHFTSFPTDLNASYQSGGLNRSIISLVE